MSVQFQRGQLVKDELAVSIGPDNLIGCVVEALPEGDVLVVELLQFGEQLIVESLWKLYRGITSVDQGSRLEAMSFSKLHGLDI